MGNARVTEMVACSLSSVTMRGVETTCASEDWFRNERVALTPSAFRNPIDGVIPVSVLYMKPPGLDEFCGWEASVVAGVEVGVVVVEMTLPPGRVVVVVTGPPPMVVADAVDPPAFNTPFPIEM